MTAGFPTDDPWGDRQQGLPLERLRRAAGARGLVQLGAGHPLRVLQPRLRDPRPDRDGGVRRAVRRVHQDPAARAAAAWTGPGSTAEEFPAGDLALGLPARPARLGGAAVRPLRRVRPDGRRVLLRRRPRPWVRRVRGRVPAGRRRGPASTGSAAPAPPRLAAGDAAAAGGDRLARGRPAARRAARAAGVLRVRAVRRRGPGARPGRVSHSGGYPGFGSNMRWHPATGLAVIALGNGTYAPMNALAELVLDALLPSSPAYHVALAPARHVAPSAPPRTPGAVAGDPGGRRSGQPPAAGLGRRVADALFSENVALDRPVPGARYADLALLRARDRRRSPSTPVRAAGRVRHPGAPPLVAGRRAGHGRGDDPAQPAAPAARPVPRPRRSRRPTDSVARPGPRRRDRVAERRRRAAWPAAAAGRRRRPTPA